MKQALSEYIVREILGDRAGGTVLSEDEDLLGTGLVDSLGVMSLVFFIEEHFGVPVPPEDVTIENFQSLNTIESYLAGKTG